MTKRYFFLGALALVAAQSASGQNLQTVSGLRLYEHHSPTISGTAGANGTQSGYDFVNRRYYHSYNKANMGKYTGQETDSIDIVEHNGPFSTKRMFGFTSGVSTIWNGDIKGNGTSLWMEAPASFNYTTAATVQQLKAVYDSTKAKPAVDTVKANTTYIGRIRGTALYVALRTATLKNSTTTDKNVYFDFDYKYGKLATAGIGDVAASASLPVYPNPAGDEAVLQNPSAQTMAVKLVASTGQVVRQLSVVGGGKTVLDLRSLAPGLYFVAGTTADGRIYSQQLIRE